MENPVSVSNEAEFQEWLARLLEAERERFAKNAAPNGFSGSKRNSEVAPNESAKEAQHHEDER